MAATCTEEEEEWGICIKLGPSFPEDVSDKGSGKPPGPLFFFIAIPKTEVPHFLFLNISRAL